MDQKQFNDKHLSMMKFINHFLGDSKDKIYICTDEEQPGNISRLINNHVSRVGKKVIKVDFTSKRRI